MKALSDEIFSLYARYPGLMTVGVGWVKCTALICLAWGSCRLLHKHSAVVRTWIWRSCFLAMLLLLLWPHRPALLRALALEVHVPTEAVVVSYSSLRKQPEVQPLGMDKGPLVIEQDQTLAGKAKDWLRKLDPWVATLWGSVFCFLFLVRSIRARGDLQQLRNSSRPAAPEVQAACERVASLSKIKSPQVRVCDHLVSPLLTGWRHPVIWLGKESEKWPASKLHAVLHHEMAHCVRGDGVWQWLATLTACLWWWNPVSWMALSRLKSETEQAADEQVLSHHVPATDYAQALIEIASSWLPRRGHALGVPMLGVSEIEKRVRELLRDNPWRGKVGALASTAVTVLAVLMSGVILVSCKQKPPAYLSLAKLVAGGQIVAGGSQSNAVQYIEYLQDFYGTIIETIESSEMRRRTLDRLKVLHPEVKETPVEVKVIQNKSSAIFNVSATGAEPNFTKVFLDCLLDEFMAFRNQIREQRRNKALTTLMEDVVRREMILKEKHEQLTDFRGKHNVAVLSARNDEFVKQMQELESERTRLEKEVAEAQTSLEDIEAAIEDRALTLGAGLGASSNGAVEGLSLIEKDYLQNRLSLVKLHAELDVRAGSSGGPDEDAGDHRLQIEKLEAVLRHEEKLIKDIIARSVERKQSRIHDLKEGGAREKAIEEAAIQVGKLIATHDALLKEFTEAEKAHKEVFDLVRRFSDNEELTSDYIVIMERASPGILVGS